MNDRALCIAFLDLPGDRWIAGRVFLENIFDALHQLDSRPQLVIVGNKPDSDASHDRLALLADKWLPYPTPVEGNAPSRLTRARSRLDKVTGRRPLPTQNEPALSTALRAAGVDALFALAVEFGPGFRIPLIEWIPDLQHMHFPEMFRPEEIRERQTRFARASKRAARILVKSQATAADVVNFIPEAHGKIRVVTPVANVPESVFDRNPREVCTEYALPERFIYLPNHFWKHKNHTVVLEALTISKTQCPDILVVCTGITHDDRAPLYFSQLLSRISAMGLRENFIVLGHVPRPHVYQLMRQSIALLQPSLFEGWSGSVEEGLSIGKRMLVSKIPVHLEKPLEKAELFDPNNALELAEKLECLWKTAQPGPDPVREARARAELPGRLKRFGEEFYEIAREAAANPP